MILWKLFYQFRPPLDHYPKYDILFLCVMLRYILFICKIQNIINNNYDISQMEVGFDGTTNFFCIMPSFMENQNKPNNTRKTKYLKLKITFSTITTRKIDI